MSIVDHFVNDFVNQHKILTNRLFVEDAAIVAKNLHHAIDYIQDYRGGNVVLCGRNKVNAKLLREKVIHTVYVLL